jgi:hypothetical protein
MRKQIFFCCVLFLLARFNNPAFAQNRAGQIVVSGGYGYSPEFDGAFAPTLYPVGTILTNFTNQLSYDFPTNYNCTSVTYNKGGALDVGITEYFSMGVAGSYQSETVNWSPEYGNSGQTTWPYSDKITRINYALRFLGHCPEDWVGKYIDVYAGIRMGESRWQDIPSQSNINLPPTISYFNGQTTVYFINKPNEVVPSFQALVGLRFFPIYNLGIHIELGLGSPYLAQTGLTFRINTCKKKTNDDN